MSLQKRTACHTILFGNIPDADDYKKIELTAKAGFRAIEGLHITDTTEISAIKEHLDAYNVSVAALAFPGLIMGMNEEELKRNAQKQIEIGAIFKCNVIVGMVPRTDGKKIHTFGTCTEHYHQAAEKLNLIGKIFSDAGMRLCIHNHIDHMTESTEEMSILMQETDENAVSICFDTAHAVCAGANPIVYAKLFMPRIGHLHIKDTENFLSGRPYFFKNSFVPLGTGVIDLTTIIELFKANDYQGWYTFELDPSFSKGNPLEEAKISREFLARF